jgi:hypothetical protein
MGGQPGPKVHEPQSQPMCGCSAAHLSSQLGWEAQIGGRDPGQAGCKARPYLKNTQMPKVLGAAHLLSK